MKQQPEKIFDLFRNNQHKLNERPSLQAWNKLERRLDQKGRTRKKHSPLFSIYSMVIAIAATVAIIFFLTTIADVRHVAASRKAVVIQETSPTEKVSTYHLAAEQVFREKYKDILQRTVEEGETGRLIVANKPIRPFLIPKRS